MREGMPALRAEQWALFDQLVKAERRRADRGLGREPFLIVYAQQGSSIKQADLGIAGGLPDVDEGDIRAILSAGLLEPGWE